MDILHRMTNVHLMLGSGFIIRGLMLKSFRRHLKIWKGLWVLPGGPPEVPESILLNVGRQKSSVVLLRQVRDVQVVQGDDGPAANRRCIWPPSATQPCSHPTQANFVDEILVIQELGLADSC